MASSSQNIGGDQADAAIYKQLWHECAGLTVEVPHIGDRVFYFPQGHLEQINKFMEEWNDPTLPTDHLPSKMLFKVVDVKFKAVHDTDEVFAEFELLPILRREEGVGSGGIRSVSEKIPSNSVRKILSVSDVTANGGCGLPKADVAKAFPPLDVSQNVASQDLVAKDLHGATWDFQHVYRGEPKRHTLVNDWKKFATDKKLKAGDTCIFTKGVRPDEIYVGVKREVSMHKRPTDLTSYDMRRGVLAEAYIASNTGCNFTVVYHPRMCSSPFIVPYHKVMEALQVNYVPGMRFQMLRDGEDPQNISRFSGVIIVREDSDPVKWRNSEWRCLRVEWDASSSSNELPPRVSPWDIQPLGLDVRHRSSIFEIGSSSRQAEANMDEDKVYHLSIL